MPIARDEHDGAGHRHRHGGDALRRVEQPRVGGGVARAEGVGAGRGEQAVDLAPGEEHHAGQNDERDRVLAEGVQRQDADCFDRERDEHGLLAADLVGYPAEEGPREAVQHPVDRQGEGQRGQHQSHDVDRHVADLEVLGDGCELRDGHQTAGSDHHEHQIHHPEHGLADDFHRPVIARALADLTRGFRRLAGFRRFQEL